MPTNRISSAIRASALFTLVLFTYTSDVFAQTVVIDSGHDPVINGDLSKSGVIGTCGQAEYVYNDQVTDILEATLKDTYRIVRTRQTGSPVDFSLLSKLPAPGKRQTLYARSAIANTVGCGAMISIHHDSTSEKNKITQPGICTDESGPKAGIRLTDAFMSRFNVGYNIFVNRPKKPTARDNESLALATAIALRIKEMGRTPSNYHAQLRDCPTCRDINPELGIMTQGLAILRTTRCPSVLIEVGNVVDPADERIVNNDEFRAKFAEAVGLGLEDYFRSKQIVRTSATP